MEKVASELHENHVFEVELENLLGAQGPVKHPKVLAKVIPNQICRCKFLFPDLSLKVCSRMFDLFSTACVIRQS